MAGSSSSGGFANRSNKTDMFVSVVQENILTTERYFHIPTGIEHRFGENAALIHDILYRSMGPTTDLLRYFPDSLYLDKWRQLPTWDTQRLVPKVLPQAATMKSTGLFSFYIEYKFSDSRRRAPLHGVPTEYIGIVEREAWLTYKRLCSDNPKIGTYLDGMKTRIALFYAATYAPAVLYGCWEDELQPIDDERAIRKDIARPNEKSVGFSTGSGTPWINFDIRRMKPLEDFLSEELFWEKTIAQQALEDAKNDLRAKLQ